MGTTAETDPIPTLTEIGEIEITETMAGATIRDHNAPERYGSSWKSTGETQTRLKFRPANAAMPFAR